MPQPVRIKIFLLKAAFYFNRLINSALGNTKDILLASNVNAFAHAFIFSANVLSDVLIFSVVSCWYINFYLAQFVRLYRLLKAE